MFMALSPGAVGVHVANLEDAILKAKDAGFGGVEFGIHEAAGLIDERGADAVRALFADAGIRPAGWGLPVDWRGPEDSWRAGLAELPRLAAAAEALGCGRTMTWILSGSDTLPFEENRRFHIERFTPIASILAERGCSLGLEFLGPKTIRSAMAHEFIWRMEDMLAMGAEIGANVGLLLDCWHWHTAGGTLDQILALRPEQVVYVHVNDAPVGVAMDDYVDNRRGLPGATGVIDIGGFLNALQTIGYDGPITPEPFGNGASWAGDALRAVWQRAGLQAE